MTGLYTMVDNTHGVWRAPANVSVNCTISPAFSITNAEQEDLNAPLNGKSVNAIRSFPGDGIKSAARSYIFEPNDANTWINMRSMIDGILRSVWKRGGLAGSSPEDAYSIHIGLGDTMNPEDVLEGILRITVLVAITLQYILIFRSAL